MEHTGRKFLRFAPDEGAVAWIDREVREDWDDFSPLLAALIVNEAHAGCCLVALQKEWLLENLHCMVKIADAVPLRARVRWIKELGEGVVLIGFEYIR